MKYDLLRNLQMTVIMFASKELGRTVWHVHMCAGIQRPQKQQCAVACRSAVIAPLPLAFATLLCMKAQ